MNIRLERLSRMLTTKKAEKNILEEQLAEFRRSYEQNSKNLDLYQKVITLLQIESHQMKLKSYDYLDKMERLISSAEILDAQVMELINSVNVLKALVNQYNNIEKSISNIIEKLRAFEFIPVLDIYISDVTGQANYHKEISDLAVKHKDLKTNISFSEMKLSKLINLSAFSAMLDTLEACNAAFMKLNDKSITYRATLIKIESVLKRLSALPDVENLISVCDFITEKIPAFKDLKNIRQLYSEVLTKINITVKQQDQEDNNLKLNKDAFREFLINLGTCPSCGSAINEEKINEITEGI